MNKEEEQSQQHRNQEIEDDEEEEEEEAVGFSVNMPGVHQHHVEHPPMLPRPELHHPHHELSHPQHHHHSHQGSSLAFPTFSEQQPKEPTEEEMEQHQQSHFSPHFKIMNKPNMDLPGSPLQHNIPHPSMLNMGTPGGMSHLSQSMSANTGVLRFENQGHNSGEQPAILYCKNISKLKSFWERAKKSSGGSTWLHDLGLEVLLPRSGFDDEGRMNGGKRQKRKSLSELSQQYKPIRKIIGIIDEVCYRENGETFRDLLRKLPEERKAIEECWVKRRKAAIEQEESKKMKEELKHSMDMSEGLAEQVINDVVDSGVDSPRNNKRKKEDLHYVPDNVKEEWGFTPEEAKAVFLRQQQQIANGEKIFCRWFKIGKEIGNQHFKELSNIGERVHYLLRTHYPDIVPQKQREVSNNPKEEWGFDADDIRNLILEYDASDRKEKLSMRKIGQILGNKHRLHPEKKPFAERNDRNQLVHSLLKKKYPELAKRFERKTPVTRNRRRSPQHSQSQTTESSPM